MATAETPALHKPEHGHPTCGVVGLGSLVELELAVRAFAKNKLKEEGLGHQAEPILDCTASTIPNSNCAFWR